MDNTKTSDIELIKAGLQSIGKYFPQANTIRILVETNRDEHKKFSQEIFDEAGPKLEESNPELYQQLLEGTALFSNLTFGAGTAIHVKSNLQS